MLENGNADPPRLKENHLHVIEIESQTLVYKNSFGVYSRDPRSTDLLYASVSEIAILLWRAGLEWNSLPKTIMYNRGD